VTADGLSAGAVARRLGVAVTTLRTWHQRYGLGPSRHTQGHHRRYSADDLARLDVMRRLTAQGVPPAEAASWARRMPAQAARTPDAAGRTPADVVSDEPPTTGRHGGGNTIAVGRAGPAARGLARAAMRMDAAAMREQIDRSIVDHGVVQTWDTVLCPVLIGVGQRHAATAALVEVEHLISRTVSEALGAVPRPPGGAGVPPILLACADEEQHSLALEALAAALAEAGLPARMLGGRVPPPALRDAVARIGPVAVVLWAQLPDTADPAQLTGILTAPAPPLLVVAAGPGWRRDALPDGVVVPGSLGEAVTLVTAAAGAGAGPGRAGARRKDPA
jgi:DNA-binding transcriptional MerR regulator